MSDINKSCSKHAGKIWETLQDSGSLTEKKILKKTGLSENEFYCGIGWLARENKIRQENNTYILDDTNLTPEIGKNAGKIWLALDIWGEVDFLSLKRLAQVKDSDVLSAIGWLARENKIWNDKHRYGLGETNLSETIGSNAGKIWDALEAWGQIDITSIARLAEIPVKDAYSAVGWLARENKIQMITSKKSTKPTFALK